MKHHHGPRASSNQLQGLIMPCLSFPPCPHLLKIVTHPEDGELGGAGFLLLLRKALRLGVLIPSQAIPHSQGLHQTGEEVVVGWRVIIPCSWRWEVLPEGTRRQGRDQP